MKIEEIEYTPNPNAVKFVVDKKLTMGGMTRSFETADAAEDVPLARRILAIDHVESVFFADCWLTVTQDGEVDWHGLMREIAEPVREAVLDDARPPKGAAGGDDDNALSDTEAGQDDPRFERAREVIDREILPYLQGDGGGLQLKALVDDQLMIRYEGACGSCPASVTGTLMAIENLIKEQVDPGLDVVSV